MTPVPHLMGPFGIWLTGSLLMTADFVGWLHLRGSAASRGSAAREEINSPRFQTKF